MTWSATLSLAGAGGEPVDLWRTIMSHGVADLPPNRIDEEARTLETTVAVPRGRPQTVIVREGRGGKAALTGTAGKRSEAVLDGVRHILRIDEDLSEFYALAAEDPDLLWVTQGAGRLMRSQTVYEDVVKTICTTNTAWSGTVRMVSAIVEHLGEPAAGAPPDSPFGRAFPSPAAMAAAPESFYRDVARSGYRGAYLRSLAAVGRFRRGRPGGARDRRPRRPPRRRGRGAPARPPRSRPLCGGAHHDAHRPLLEARARLLDPPEVREPERAEGEGHRDRAPLSPLRALLGARLLALPHA